MTTYFFPNLKKDSLIKEISVKDENVSFVFYADKKNTWLPLLQNLPPEEVAVSKDCLIFKISGVDDALDTARVLNNAESNERYWGEVIMFLEILAAKMPVAI
jgi:hypothetical protein